MATLPIVPAFVAGDTSITKLQQLSQAVSFLVDCDVRPTWHMYQTTTTAITGSTWTTPGTKTIAYDDDGVAISTAMIATIVTQGYYAVEACLPIRTLAGAQSTDCAFLVTAGPNNPHHVNGTTTFFGQRGNNSFAGTGGDATGSISDICPWVLFPGDTVQPQAWISAAATMDFNTNTTYLNGRFVTNFTGYWLRTGS